MRKFIDGRGNDSSIAARAYLAAHRKLILPDFYVINTTPQLAQPSLAARDYGPATQASYYERSTRTLWWIVDWVIDVDTVVVQVSRVDLDSGEQTIVDAFLPAPYLGTFIDFFIMADNTFFYLAAESGYFYGSAYQFEWHGGGGKASSNSLGLWGMYYDAAGPMHGLNNANSAVMKSSQEFIIGDGEGGICDVDFNGDCGQCWAIQIVDHCSSWLDCLTPGCCADNRYVSPIVKQAVTGALTEAVLIPVLDNSEVVWFINQGGADPDANCFVFSYEAVTTAKQTWIPNSATCDGGNCNIVYGYWETDVPGPTFSYNVSLYVTGRLLAAVHVPADDSIIIGSSDGLHKWDVATQTMIGSLVLPPNPENSGSTDLVGMSQFVSDDGLIVANFSKIDPVTLTIVETVDPTQYSGLGAGDTQWFGHQYDSRSSALYYLDGAGHVMCLKPFMNIPSGQRSLGTQFLLTDYPSSLVWDYKGKFLTAVISLGEVESKIGLEADTLDITWSPKDSDVLGDGEVSALAAFGFGLFDNGTVEVWRCVMPRHRDLIGSPGVPARLGDCNTFGAALMFSGRIGDVTPDRAKVVMTVISRMDTLNVEVPTNIIEPTNVFAYCGVGQIPTGGAPSFSVVAGSTTLIIYGDPATDEDLYDGGYLVFGDNSKLSGVHARILLQTVVEGHNAFYLSEALPFAPATGDIFAAYVGLPLDASGKYGGFRWVPSPDNSAVII